MLKVKNKNTTKKCKTCQKLTARYKNDVNVLFEQISHLS